MIQVEGQEVEFIGDDEIIFKEGDIVEIDDIDLLSGVDLDSMSDALRTLCVSTGNIPFILEYDNITFFLFVSAYNADGTEALDFLMDIIATAAVEGMDAYNAEYYVEGVVMPPNTHFVPDEEVIVVYGNFIRRTDA